MHVSRQHTTPCYKHDWMRVASYTSILVFSKHEINLCLCLSQRANWAWFIQEIYEIEPPGTSQVRSHHSHYRRHRWHCTNPLPQGQCTAPRVSKRQFKPDHTLPTGSFSVRQPIGIENPSLPDRGTAMMWIHFPFPYYSIYPVVYYIT